MRASDLPEDEWRAHQARMRKTLERADATLADTGEWLAQRRADGTELEERYAERQRQEIARAAVPPPAAPNSPPIRRAPAPPVGKIIRTHRVGGNLVAQSFEGDSAAAATSWERHIQDVVDRKIAALDKQIDTLAREIGAICGQLDRRISELEARATQQEEAAAALLLALDKRVAALEERAVPRPGARPTLLVADDDAA